MDICTSVAPGAGFISSTTAFIDCQAQVLGSGAWSALAAPGSTLHIVLTGFLTIFIALIGYNLLLGRTMSVRDGTLAFVKIGAVFALATSWPAYRTLVYDLAVDGPSQLVAEIGPQSGIVGSDGTLAQRLDFADQALAQLTVLGPGNPPASIETRLPPPPFGGFDAFALGGSRILFDFTAIAALGVVRVVIGLMLALGPFFIAFLMFESTRSLFEGWVRVLAGAALSAVGVSIALGLELAFVEPWLGNVLARRMAGEALPTISIELFVIAGLFALLVLAALYACARVARAFELAPVLRVVPGVLGHSQTSSSLTPVPERSTRVSAEQDRRRAAAIASVVGATGIRERREIGLPVAAEPRSVSPVTHTHDRSRVTAPVGRSFARRAHSRVSASANRRDEGA